MTTSTNTSPYVYTDLTSLLLETNCYAKLIGKANKRCSLQKKEKLIYFRWFQWFFSLEDFVKAVGKFAKARLF